MNQTMLCIASELASIADAVAPIVWDGPDYNTIPVPGFPNGPWTIPVQRSADKFIARQLAINVLGNLAFTDMTWPTLVLANRRAVCSQLYANAIKKETALTATELGFLFGGPDATYFEPFGTVDLNSKTPIIKGRMLFQAHILRGASRLLKDLLDKSVEADMAGTERRRAHETDPRRGAKLAWGIPKSGETPYNTLAAATRMIAGRW